MTEGERLLDQYAARLQFPELSSAEARDLLEIRDSLTLWEPDLSDDSLTRLADADDLLLRQAPRLIQILGGAAELRRLRAERNPPPEYWWWNLERLG